MGRTRWLAALAALVLAGAAAAQTAGAPVPIDGADPAIWQGQPASGPIVHLASKVSLPAELAGFTRFRVGAVSAEDSAAGYRRGDGDTEIATVYLFRRGSLPEHSLKGSVTAFGMVSPTAFVWANGPFDVPGAQPLHGYKGVFKTGIGPDTLMDYLYFFELGRWTVKVRATLSKVKEPEQEARIDAFVRALPWDQILAANGACSGAACSAPAFEPFDSHYFESMLGPLLATKMKFNARKERDLPVAARLPIGIMGATDIRRSSEDPLVYVAEVEGMGAYRLVSLPAAATPLLTDAFGRLSIAKPIYGVLIRMGGRDLMPRLFHGEPTPEAFAEAVSELILHPTADPFVTVKATAAAMPD
jgi:hypothetical protein